MVIFYLAFSSRAAGLEIHNAGRNLRYHVKSASAELGHCTPSTMLPEDQIAVNKALVEGFMNETRSQVLSWPVLAANTQKTDRVAVTVFQPRSRLDLYSYIVRWNSRMLGPNWAIQIFYGTDDDKAALDHALGSPPNVIWTPIFIRGLRKNTTTLEEYNILRLSGDFWEAIRQEHVLIYETDSMVLRNDGCVDRFLAYDYVGAPWGDWIGGNGGFTLRRRSTEMVALQRPELKDIQGPHPEVNYSAEDTTILMVMRKMNVSIAPRDEEAKFAVESVNEEAPCGFHKPWDDCDQVVIKRFLRQARQAMP